MSLSASLLLGTLLGVAYTASALLVARRAGDIEDGNKALQVILGGMLARMALTLIAFGAILAFVPVQRGPFVLGLGVVFVIGLVAEVFLVLGRQAASTPGS